MKITASLLFYAFGKTDHTLSISWGTDQLALEEICVCAPSETELPRGSYLYIQGNRLFTPEPRGSVCMVRDGLCGNDLASAILQVWNRLLTWENTLCSLLLSQAPVETLFAHGLEYLHPRYALVTRNFRPMLISPAMRHDPQITYSPEIHSAVFQEEVINTLLLDKKFHAAAALQEPFYYGSIPESFCYCQNIFIHEQYYARFIMMLERSEDRLSPGEEQIFAIFLTYLQQYFRHQTGLLYRSPSDIIHQICRTLIDGGTVSLQLLEDTLNHADWKITHTYIMTELQFFEESGWKSQLETTLPYLTHKLERVWPHSCILTREDKLLCLTNLTLTEPHADTETAFSGFCKKLALFVRENVCTAGVSSLFRDFTQVRDGAIQASAALTIGREKAPGYWYYLYDQYRLPHILQAITKELSSGMYLHPALSLLRQYDREHGAQLADTLKAYLDCGQNMSAAAASLYIHRTSFCRRMDRIREITEMDLNDADTILLLRLSFALESGTFSAG